MKKNFKKSDLKTGMRAIERSGCVNIVIQLDTGTVLISDDGFHRLDEYREDLIMDDFHEHDIMYIRERPCMDDLINTGSSGKLLWMREKPFLTLDGVEYSEETIRSLIKKATS